MKLSNTMHAWAEPVRAASSFVLPAALTVVQAHIIRVSPGDVVAQSQHNNEHCNHTPLATS